MLDIELIRDHPDKVKKAIQAKGAGRPEIVDEIRQLDTEWRRGGTELQRLKTELNERGRKIAVLMRDGAKDEAETLVQANAALKSRAAEVESELKIAAESRSRLLLELPNIPHATVPAGSTPGDNVEHSRWGEAVKFDFESKPHWELLETHMLVDFVRGAKVTGAGFPFYVGLGARLQRALISWFLDRATGAGYIELLAPHFVNAESATATGQLPDKEDQMYEIGRDELYAIPTAEIPITNFLRGEIIEHDALPVRFCGYTPCFRREAGSYGKEVRGLNRLHQFDKVELVQFVHPDHSYEALEEMCSYAEGLLQQLQLPYRRLLMCTGEMGFTQAKKYDLEIWSPGQKR